MFTGIVDDVGVLRQVTDTPIGRQLVVACRYRDLVPGESVSVSGVCLTVREAGPGWFSAAASRPTLQRSTIASWQEGRRVNLERALQAGGRLGGHFVLGHVDGVGTLLEVNQRSDARVLKIAVGPEVAPYLVPRGSVAVDGVSLTIAGLPDQGIMELAIVEFTERHTTLGELKPGDEVNVEGDIIGKYVRSFLERSGERLREEWLGETPSS